MSDQFAASPPPPQSTVHQAAERASYLNDIGRPQEAAALLQAEPETPVNVRALLELSRSLINLDRKAEALTAAEAVIRLAPDHPSGWVMSAIALRRLDRPVEAQASARRAVQLSPEFSEAHRILAIALADLGRFDEARSHVGVMMKLDPDIPDPWLALCGVEIAQQRWSDAEQSAIRALSLDPQSDQAKALLAIAQSHSGAAGEKRAIETLVTSLRSNPDQSHIRALLVEIVKPSRMPIPLWVTAPIAMLGGAGLLLAGWAIWAATRWFDTPADVRRLVMADPSARLQIRLAVAAAVAATIVLLVASVIVGFENLSSTA